MPMGDCKSGFECSSFAATRDGCLLVSSGGRVSWESFLTNVVFADGGGVPGESWCCVSSDVRLGSRTSLEIRTSNKVNACTCT